MHRCLGLLVLLGLFSLPMFANAGMPWTQSVRQGDFIYFYYAPVSRIERFDLVTETLSPPIFISCPTTAFSVDVAGFYVACSNSIYFVSLDGVSQTLLAVTTQPIKQILVGSTHIYAIEDNEIWAVNKTTGVSQYKTYNYTISKAVYSAVNKKIYARNVGVSPSDIMMVTINADGTLGTMTDSPYHGAYPFASAVWLSSDESRILDNSGTLYGPSLTWLGAIGVAFDNAVLTVDGHIMVNKGAVLSYFSPDTALESTATLAAIPQSIFIYNDSVYAFSSGQTDAPVIEKLTLNAMSNPEEPGVDPVRPKAPVVDPTQLSYVPDSVLVDNEGIIYLLHKASKNIFRWSSSTHQYLPSIPLYGAPYAITYSAGLGKLYVEYADGEITSINPANLDEIFFYRLADLPCGISANAQYVYACDISGAWESHYVINSSGTRTAYKEWNHPSKEYVWNASNNRFYFFRDSSSPNDLLWEEVLSNGTIGTAGESPYHGNPIVTQYPIRVSPTGGMVLLGSGQLFNAIDLNLVYTLPEPISAALWLDGTLWTARKNATRILLDQWTSLYNRQRTLEISGTVIELLNINGNITVVYKRNNTTQFVTLSATEDLDNDGLTDLIDLKPAFFDADQDSIEDIIDNCVSVSNVDQLNTDNDAEGNVCDADDDNDGVADASDSFPLDATESVDADGDGVGNNADTTPNGDIDNDGIDNLVDNCPSVSNTNQVNLDGDTQGDVCDATPNGDNDGDGVDNATDNCPTVSNADQVDIDADGAGDMCDLFPLNGELLLEQNGAAKNESFASSIAMADMNGDGVIDVLVGAPMVNVPAGSKVLKKAGAIRIISGKDNSILSELNGTTANQQFGTAIAVVDDQNGDGIPDVVVGEPLADIITTVPRTSKLKNAGRVAVYSGSNGALLNIIAEGSKRGDHFGAAVAMGDVNNNSQVDLIVGAPLVDATVKNGGRVTVFSGVSNTVLYQRNGDQIGENFGSAVAVDHQRLLVGSSLRDVVKTANGKVIKLKDAGRVQVFNAANGDSSALLTLDGAAKVDHLGAAISAANDEWAVGIPLADAQGKDTGSVQLFSGLNIMPVDTILGRHAGDNFGSALNMHGDVNKDGTNDIAIGAAKFDANTALLLKDAGRVEVLSGAALLGD